MLLIDFYENIQAIIQFLYELVQGTVDLSF